MNEVGIKVRKFFLVIQLLAALVVLIGVIVVGCNVDSVSSSLQSAETFFGAVMAVRVGIIITFITSIIICAATYFLTRQVAFTLTKRDVNLSALLCKNGSEIY